MEKASLKFLHPQSDGEGSAMSVEMHYQMENKPGFIRFKISDQNGTKFDFDNSIRFDMEVVNLSKVLMILNDEVDVIDDGVPLKSDNTMFAMKRIEAENKYAFAMCEGEGEEMRKAHIVLSKPEAIGLRSSIQGAMFFLSFIKGVNP